MSCLRPRISVSKTYKEWEVLENRLQQMSRSSVKLYIQNEARKFASRMQDAPKMLPLKATKTQVRQFYIDADTYSTLMEVSKTHNIPVSDLIDQLFIIPIVILQP